MQRRFILCAILIMSLIAIPGRVKGLGPIRKLNAPINVVELSGTEPLPPGVSNQASFGAPTYSFAGTDPIVPAPQWVNNSAVTVPFESDNNPKLCGVPDVPQGTLTYPDGQTTTIQGTATVGLFTQPGCWIFDIGAAYGMELGQYNIQLAPPNDQLGYTWQIDYPKAVPPIYGTRTSFKYNNEPADLLMGFMPHQSVRLDFYTTKRAGQVVVSDYYIASRTFQTDGRGAFIVDIKISRTASFTRPLVNFTYTPVASATPTPASTESASVSSTGNCDGFTVPSRVQIGGKARVTPGDPNLILSDPSRLSEGTASQLGVIRAGEVMTILSGPACDIDILFWKVSYQGVTGWTGEGQGSTYWIEPIN